MSGYTRSVIFFFICWIVFYFVIQSAWHGENAGSAALLFGGVLSIVCGVIYGLFNELWIQHRQF